jgi:hypothetical protein
MYLLLPIQNRLVTLHRSSGQILCELHVTWDGVWSVELQWYIKSCYQTIMFAKRTCTSTAITHTKSSFECQRRWMLLHALSHLPPCTFFSRPALTTKVPSPERSVDKRVFHVAGLFPSLLPPPTYSILRGISQDHSIGISSSPPPRRPQSPKSNKKSRTNRKQQQP